MRLVIQFSVCEFSINNVEIHLLLRVGIQSSNFQEVECGFNLMSQIQSTKAKVSAGTVKEKVSYCTVTGDREG